MLSSFVDSMPCRRLLPGMDRQPRILESTPPLLMPMRGIPGNNISEQCLPFPCSIMFSFALSFCWLLNFSISVQNIRAVREEQDLETIRRHCFASRTLTTFSRLLCCYLHCHFIFVCLSAPQNGFTRTQSPCGGSIWTSCGGSIWCASVSARRTRPPSPTFTCATAGKAPAFRGDLTR
jgi:hypothetical protein